MIDFNQEFIHDNSRSSISLVSGSASSDQYLPATLLEKALSVRKSSVHTSGKGEGDSVGVGKLITAEEDTSWAKEGNNQYTANPLRVKFGYSSPESRASQLSMRPYVTLVLQHIKKAGYSAANTTSVSFVTNCAFENPNSEVNHTCPSGEVVTHRCTGVRQTYRSVCPSRRYVPVCRILSTAHSDKDPVCEVISFTDTSVTCNCSIPLQRVSSSRARRLAVFISDVVESSGYIEMVSMSEYTFEGFISTNSDINDVTFDDVKNGMIIITMFACFWGFGLLGTVLLARQKRHTDKSRIQHHDTGNDSRSRDSDVSIEGQKELIISFIDEVLPSMFQSSQHGDSIFVSIWKSIVAYHPYAEIFTASGHEARDVQIKKGLYLLTIQSMLMFIMAVFFDLQFPESDEYCSSFRDESPCLAPKSMFDNSVSTCKWVSGDSSSMCISRDAELSARAIVLISVLIAMATAPINMLVDFLFDVISAPSVSEYGQQRRKRRREDRRGRNKSSNRYNSVLRKFTLPGASSRQFPTSVHKLFCNSEIHLHSNLIKNSCRSTEQRECRLAEIEFLMLEQHDHLNFHDRKDFEGRWGLDYRSFEWIRSSSDEVSSSRQKNVERKVLAWKKRILEYVDETADMAKARAEELVACSDMQRGVEILHQFIVDLLGRDNRASKIFLSMTYEDFKESFVVTTLAKRCAWTAIVFINVYFVYFSILRGITSSVSWQRDYVMACMLQLVMEVCLFETMECLWIHWVIPQLVRREVEAAVDMVKHAVDLAFERGILRSPPIFDSPKYFFVSRQLAKQFPHLVEASVVQAFHTYFPPHELDATLKVVQHFSTADREDVRHDTSMSTKKKNRGLIFTFSQRFNVSIAVFSMLQYLGTISIRFQQLILHTLQPIVVGLFALLYWFFLDHPFSVLCPLACLVVYEGLMHLHRRHHHEARKIVPAINDARRHASIQAANFSVGSFPPLQSVPQSSNSSLSLSHTFIQNAVENAHRIVKDGSVSIKSKLSSLEECFVEVEDKIRDLDLLELLDERVEEGDSDLMRDALWYSYRLEASPVVLPFVDLLGRKFTEMDLICHRRSQQEDSLAFPETSIELSALRLVKQVYEYHIMCVRDAILSSNSGAHIAPDPSEQCASTLAAADIWKDDQVHHVEGTE